MERKNQWLLAFLFVTAACVLVAGCVGGPVEDGGNLSEGGGGQPATGAVCGDGTCDSSEDCSSCASDCGACSPVCGDDTCDSTEDCLNCADDCEVCAEEPESNETEGNVTGLEEPCAEQSNACYQNAVYRCISSKYVLSVPCRTDQVCTNGQCHAPEPACGDGVCSAPHENSLNCLDDCDATEIVGPNIHIKTVSNVSTEVCFEVYNDGTEDLYEANLSECEILVDGEQAAWYRPEKGGETFTQIRVDKYGRTELCLCAESKDESVFPTCDEDYNADLERTFFPYEVAGKHITITFVNALNGQTDSMEFWSPAN